MPRKKMISVVGFDRLAEGREYPCGVLSIEVNRNTLAVTLAHLSVDQEGRRHLVSLPLPARPAGKTRDFLVALGVDVRIGVDVDPWKCVNGELLVTFRKDADGQLVADKFAPLVENKNESVASS